MPAPESDDDLPPCDEEEDAPPGAADYLYIMRNPKIAGELKVGRSANPVARAIGLSKSHNFWLEIVQAFPGHGDLERKVHERLASRRVGNSAGQEWFAVDPETAACIIHGVIAEASLVRSTAG
jgi:hypothetical protein